MQQIFWRRTSRKLYSARSPPPRKPPSNGTSDIFDDFPPIRNERQREKVIEQLVVHLLWDKLERLGFNIYPEQKISHSRRIDLIATMDNKIIKIIGIEVKCKKKLSSRDWEQIREYKTILESHGIPFIVFYLNWNIMSPRNEVPVIFKSEESDKIKIAKENIVFGFISITKFNNLPLLHGEILRYEYETSEQSYEYVRYPYYPDLNLKIPVIQDYTVLHYTSVPVEDLFYALLSEAKQIYTQPFKLSESRELYIEHALWKYLRSQGYRVLCQYPIQKITNKLGRVDLVAVSDRKRLAIEVKQKLTSSSIQQAWEYKLSPSLWEYWMYIGIPQSELKKLKKFSAELNKTEVGVVAINEETVMAKFYDPPFEIKEEKGKQPTILDFIMH